MSQATIVNAKITIPNLISSSIIRDRLLQLLERGQTKKLTIIHAPAGYGKTTLLSQWACRVKNQTAWVSLNYSDNDPILFWQSIAKAIGTVTQTDLYERLLPLFQIQPRVPIELFVDLINHEIKDNPSKIQLILDDYQAITHSVIHRSMTRFITYAPANLRILIGSQNELPLPLLKWKSESFLHELNKDTIKFNYKETADYFKRRSLPSEDLNTVHEIYKKTEGWPTGIKVLTNILREKPLDSIDDYQFSGKNPFVSDYLFYELLKSLSNEETKFLLRTSVLDFLEPTLCTKLTGHKNSLQMLISLEEKGVFVSELDAESSIYRYHPMFSNFLIREIRLRCSLTELTSLYSTAALHLYEQNDFMNAIDLALRGDIFELAMEWIAKHVPDVLSIGQTETFVGWIDLLVLKKQKVHASMIVLQAFALAMLNDFGRAMLLIQQFEGRNEIQQWIMNKDYETVSDYLGTKAYILAVGLNDIEESMNLMLERLKYESGHSRIDKISIRYNLYSPSLLSTRLGAKGKLSPDDALQNFFIRLKNADYKNLNMTGYLVGVVAETLVEKNWIDKAIPIIKEATRIGRYYNDPGILVPMIFLKCHMEMSNQRFSEATGLLERLETFVLKQNERQWLNSIYAMKAQIYLEQNKNAEAEQELSKVALLDHYIGGTGNEFSWLVYVGFLIKTKDYDRGLKTIIQIKRVAKEEKQITTAIEALRLEALLHKMMGKERLALDTIHKSLAIGYPHGYIRSFVSDVEIIPLIQKYVTLRKKHEIDAWKNVPSTYLEKLIVAINQKRINLSHFDTKNPINELTPREFEVLSHLTNGLTNREIATELFLSPGTVRIYLSNIYAKLKVNSRTQAVIIAKQNKPN